MAPGEVARADAGALTLRRWNVAEWLGNEAAWSRLLARSKADILFLSWDWLTLWWQCFGEALSAAPEILAFYRGEDLVGIAPLYRRRVVRSGFLPVSSVQLMGLSWRDPGPLISEYLDVIAATGEAVDAVQARLSVRRPAAQEPSMDGMRDRLAVAGKRWHRGICPM